MFDKLKNIWNRIVDKVKAPVAALSLVGISTTLACCYGPAPEYPVETYDKIETCEVMLRECAVSQGLWSESCSGESFTPCNKMIEQQAERIKHNYNDKTDPSYLNYVLDKIDKKIIPPSVGLLAAVEPWHNHHTSGLNYPIDIKAFHDIIEIADILEANSSFKDKSNQMLVSQIILTSPFLSNKNGSSSDNSMIRPRAYELAAAAIASNSVIEPFIGFVLSEIAADIETEKNYKYDFEKGNKYYSLHLALSKFGTALVDCYDRINSAGDGVHIDEAKNTIEKLKKLAKDTAALGDEIRPTAEALLARIAQSGL